MYNTPGRYTTFADHGIAFSAKCDSRFEPCRMLLHFLVLAIMLSTPLVVCCADNIALTVLMQTLNKDCKTPPRHKSHYKHNNKADIKKLNTVIIRIQGKVFFQNT